MPDQLAAMRDVYRVVKPGGACLIRVPIASSNVWKLYRTDWVELDAPRHFYLHTAESMKLLAGSVGFELVDLEWDADSFSYWGSEQYRRGIALFSESSYAVGKSESEFTFKEMADFEKRAEEDNDEEAGGRACFIFKKPE